MSPREAPRARILVVDDERAMAEMLADGLADRGYQATALSSSEEAKERLRAEPYDALVTDLRMPGVDGLALLAEARRVAPDLPVIVMTAYGAVDSAVESIRRGASHYLTKPFKLDELCLFLDRLLDERQVRREAKALRQALDAGGPEAGVIGTSAAIRRVLEVLERMARSDVPVLLLGETGTGKGLFARLLHAWSDRASGPFVTVNCAALPEPLLESELFGHVKGAFTGATRDARGLVVESGGGTLFLDEIAETSPSLQAKLLDVLERRVVRAVGSAKERPVDLRIVAATHRDLSERVAAGAFREDLRYRLDVVSVELPPLRHRREDIPLLLEHFLREARRKHPSSPAEHIAPATLARLLDHPWPGNVRELAYAVERLVLLARGAEIDSRDLPPAIAAPRSEGLGFSGAVMPVRELQRRYAAWALEQLGGQKKRTAEKLGIDLKTLTKWLSENDAPGPGEGQT
jgi:two-component system response regulator HydG